MSECKQSVYLAEKSIDMIDAVNMGYDKGRKDGAREFAEWFANKMNFSKEWVNYQIEHWKQNGTVITFQRKEEE